MIEKIKQSIGINDELTRTVNSMVDAVNALKAMRGENGISVNVTDSDTVIGNTLGSELGGGGGGSGLPDGYGPEEWTVYDGGVVTTRNFLTDNPD